MSGSFQRRFSVQVHWITECNATFGWSYHLPRSDMPVKVLRLSMDKVHVLLTSRRMP